MNDAAALLMKRITPIHSFGFTQPIMRSLFLFVFVLVFGLAGCSPTYDWREVRDAEVGWSILFPGKPMVVTRTVALQPSPELTPGRATTEISLTMHASRIKDVSFALGLVKLEGKTPAEREAVRRALEASRVKNIRGRIDSIDPKALGSPLSARGTLQLKANGDPVPARLLMRSVVRNGWVIEAIVVGPSHGFPQDEAQQFLDSLRVGTP